MIDKHRLDNITDKAMKKEDPAKVAAASRKGVKYWSKVYSTLCTGCRKYAVNKTLKLMKNPNSPKFTFDELCEECKKNIKEIK